MRTVNTARHTNGPTGHWAQNTAQTIGRFLQSKAVNGTSRNFTVPGEEGLVKAAC